MKFVDFNPKEPKVSNRYGNIVNDLRGDNMNAISTDLTKEDLQLIYLLLHKVPISYTMTTGMEYEVLDLIEKVGKEIDNRLLKGE